MIFKQKSKMEFEKLPRENLLETNFQNGIWPVESNILYLTIDLILCHTF